MSNSWMTDGIGITWRAPVIAIVLAATAIPVEFRAATNATAGLGLDIKDIIANVAGYIPVGIVLEESGLVLAILAAALLSTFAEASQLVIMHRAPSAIDVATNILGATVGALAGRHWQFLMPAFRVGRRHALGAAILALLLLLGMWAASGAVPNDRGVTTAGALEARWKFDESGGRQVVDSSGHGLSGRLEGRPKRVAGRMGGAIGLDGKADRINLGQSGALRLGGSMTVSAWINPASFPADDAAIVSSLKGSGYQLDTTIDAGPRTIGFKLIDACDELTARYGATPLVVATWYHVAGVYNAEAKTLDVYLNGELDNGSLRGTVPGGQHSSRGAVYVGRRSGLAGFNFAGSIDDVRIYSVALTKSQIAAAMRGADVDVAATERRLAAGAEARRVAGEQAGEDSHCAVISDPEDAIIPAAAGTLGVLVGVACAGLWPSRRVVPGVVAGVAAGMLLLKVTGANLPGFNLWLVPLTCAVGSVSVIGSLSRRSE